MVRTTVLVMTILPAVLVGCGGSSRQKVSAAQSRAVSSLFASLGDRRSATQESGALGLAGRAFAAGFLLAGMPPYGGGLPGTGASSQPLSDPCYTQRGGTITFACPGVTGTVTIAGERVELDLTLAPGSAGVPGLSGLRMSGHLVYRDGYSTGSLLYATTAAMGTGTFQLDFELWNGGPCSRGWMTFAWGGSAPPFESRDQFIRVTVDCDDIDVEYP